MECKHRKGSRSTQAAYLHVEVNSHASDLPEGIPVAMASCYMNTAQAVVVAYSCYLANVS